MSSFKFELSYKGVGQLLKSDSMREALNTTAEEIKTRCGDGYGSHVMYRKTRLVGAVFPETAEAYKDNLENNTILKAVR